MSKNTAVDWLVNELRNQIANSTLDAIAISKLKMQAKAMEREHHSKTWDAALDAGESRAWNVMRAYDDFDEYYTETYKGGEQ